MAEKSQNADSGKEITEKNKIINKKEKTTQQQKGLPTLLADLKKLWFHFHTSNLKYNGEVYWSSIILNFDFLTMIKHDKVMLSCW